MKFDDLLPIVRYHFSSPKWCRAIAQVDVPGPGACVRVRACTCVYVRVCACGAAECGACTLVRLPSRYMSAPPHVSTLGYITYITSATSPRSRALVLSYLNRRLREAMATPIHINFVRIVLIVPICKLLTVPKDATSRLSTRGRPPAASGVREFREIFATLSI